MSIVLQRTVPPAPSSENRRTSSRPCPREAGPRPRRSSPDRRRGRPRRASVPSSRGSPGNAALLPCARCQCIPVVRSRRRRASGTSRRSGSSRLRVLREDQGERDERPAVARPCLHHRKERPGGAILLDHLLAGGGGDGLRDEVGEPRKLREHLELSRKFVGISGSITSWTRSAMSSSRGYAQREHIRSIVPKRFIASGTDVSPGTFSKRIAGPPAFHRPRRSPPPRAPGRPRRYALEFAARLKGGEIIHGRSRNAIVSPFRGKAVIHSS